MKPGETFTSPETGKTYIAVKNPTCYGCAFDHLKSCKGNEAPMCSELFNDGVSIQFHEVDRALDNGTIND